MGVFATSDLIQLTCFYFCFKKSINSFSQNSEATHLPFLNLNFFSLFLFYYFFKDFVGCNGFFESGQTGKWIMREGEDMQ